MFDNAAVLRRPVTATEVEELIETAHVFFPAERPWLLLSAWPLPEPRLGRPAADGPSAVHDATGGVRRSTRAKRSMGSRYARSPPTWRRPSPRRSRRASACRARRHRRGRTRRVRPRPQGLPRLCRRRARRHVARPSSPTESSTSKVCPASKRTAGKGIGEAMTWAATLGRPGPPGDAHGFGRRPTDLSADGLLHRVAHDVVVLAGDAGLVITEPASREVISPRDAVLVADPALRGADPGHHQSVRRGSPTPFAHRGPSAAYASVGAAGPDRALHRAADRPFGRPGLVQPDEVAVRGVERGRGAWSRRRPSRPARPVDRPIAHAGATGSRTEPGRDRTPCRPMNVSVFPAAS